jgi:phosphoribosylcarboxyaminoimidazole (NCAIR) mutase
MRLEKSTEHGARSSMPDVLILVGSESDKPRIEPAFEVLTKAGCFV